MIDETVEEIADMQTHSASNVAIKAARALLTVADREVTTVEEYERDLERNASVLRRANPSHAILQNAMADIVDAVSTADLTDVEDAKAVTRSTVDTVIENVRREKQDAAANAVPLFEDGSTILTHDYSSTVLAGLERAVEDGRELEVYVTEARPRYLGRRTARRLAGLDGVETHLIVDSAAGHHLPECDRVITGITSIVDDNMYNRIGTFPLAATANEVGTPMVAVGASSKIVGKRFVFENEYRPVSEVMREPAEGFDIENPGYDATPLSLVDTIITDDGELES